jgi:hypothetical protein
MCDFERVNYMSCGHSKDELIKCCGAERLRSLGKHVITEINADDRLLVGVYNLIVPSDLSLEGI